jgi:citrate lyase subunit beta/citryl-CoA lyase
VHAPADVTAAEAVLITGGFSQQLWIMAETPSAILQLAAITAASPRVAAIVMGTADLAAALRMPGGSGSPALGTANALALLAARARGVDIIAGIHPDLADHDGLAAACRAERAAGFDGKTLIHPAQIEVANDAFGVSDADAAAAAALVAAWERAAAGGSGIAVVDGRMVEKLHADDARRLLALHAAARRA